jgi:hypothetical protein
MMDLWVCNYCEFLVDFHCVYWLYSRVRTDFD